jgi:selenocysteine lyase/cysteine desulfurase
MEREPGATLVSSMEHHSNDLPHRRRGDVHRIGVLADGTIDYTDLEEKLRNNRIKLVAITGASNVTGYMPDIRLVARLAHERGARVLVDAAQLVAHHAVNMEPNESNEHVDFLAAAGHKAYAPFGSAFLVAPNDLLERTEPYVPGGGTVKFVTDTDVVWADGVERHTGGTPNIPGVIALGDALKWLSDIGLDWVRAHELELLKSVEGRLRAIEGVAFLGDIPAERKLGVLPFNIRGIHHEQVAAVLNNEYGIATRNGCFCAHPYLTRLLNCTDPESVRLKVEAGEDVLLPGAVRATIGIYNNAEDLDKLVNAVADLAAEVLRGNTFTDQVKQSACTEAM